MEIGKTIKEVRIKRGISQGDFATRIGLSQTAVSQMERGAQPRKQTLKKICKVLQVPEPFLHLMSVTEVDVPRVNRRKYNELFPTARQIIESIFDISHHNDNKHTSL